MGQFEADTRPIRFAEFFAGIGLMRLGLEKLGWQCVFANDIDASKAKMYSHHFGKESSFFLGDIQFVHPRDIPQIDLATASFPCTDLSLAGLRQGLGGSHSSAFWLFADLMEKLDKERPRAILLENVFGLLNSKNGSDLHAVLSKLNALGYLVDVISIDARSFVPQSRPRLFIVGSLVGLRRQHNLRRSTHSLIDQFRCEHLEIDWLDVPLPALPQCNIRFEKVLDQISEDHASWWSEERSKKLLSQLNGRHLAEVESRLGAPHFNYFPAFRRTRSGRSCLELRTDGLAGCLRTPKGGSAKQIVLRVGRGRFRARLLLPTECARLMGAEGFRMDSSDQQAYFAFGDAVCVPAVEWLARHAIAPLVASSRKVETRDLVAM